MAWDKDKIVRENGDIAEAQAPVIISASRSTDIPAFMQIGSSTDWKRIFSMDESIQWRQKLCFIQKHTFHRILVKNPKPLIPYLKALREKASGATFSTRLMTMNKKG